MAKKQSISSSLCPEAQGFLDNLYIILKEGEVSTSLDENSIRLIANTYNTYILMTNLLNKLVADKGAEGYLILSPRGELKAHPAVKIQNDSQIQLDKLYDKFGLNPKARKEISKPKEKGKELTPIDVFLQSTKHGKS
jgi:P27 family predicted phage terminase small subunit